MTTGGPIKRTKDDLAAGTKLGRYRLEHPVGRGGMGTVYRAFDETTNRNVAIKLLAEGIQPSLRERFLAECEAEANIRHEHVMPVYDRGWYTDERPYFVMELVYEPITLSELMDVINHGQLGSRHPRLRAWNDPRKLIADVVLPICEGVHVANSEYGIQHRDLKPDNVLIDIRTRRAYLIDFGICRSLDDDQDVGRIVGTPRFLSPEQARASTSDQTDVWGLGAILRYVVTGEPPLARTSPFTRAEVRKRVAALKDAQTRALAAGEDAKAAGYGERLEQLEDPTLRVQEDLLRDARDGVYLSLPEHMSAGLAAVIQKAMATDPEDRYTTAGELAEDVRTWVAGGGVHALQEKSSSGALVDLARRLLNRNNLRVAGALVALAVGVALGAGLFTKTPPAPDHRLKDAEAELADIDRAWRALTTGAVERAPSPAELAVIGRLFRTQADAAQTRLEAAGGKETLGPLWSLSRLEFGPWRPQGWSVQDLTGQTPLANDPNDGLKASSGGLRPGLYHVHSAPQHGVRLLLSVPTRAGEGFRDDGGQPARRIQLGRPDLSVPGDMIWVPAGKAEPGSDTVVPAFVAGRDYVTNERYSEWLDDLPAAERAERVPPQGFVRGERDTSRWLVAPGMASKPVLGVRPRDAAAYAAWRGEVEEATVRLPDERDWLRMAALDRMRDRGAPFIFPWRSAPQWKLRHRRGAKDAISATGRMVRGESPYGVRQLFTGPGEIVISSDGNGYRIKGAGGLLPHPDAARRSATVEPDAVGHGYGFRVVMEP